MTILKRISLGMGGVLLCLLLCSTWLFTTTSGLILTIHLANLFLPGTLKIINAQGSLLRKISFSQLIYDDELVHVTMNNGNIQVLYPTLNRHTITLQQVNAEQLTVTALNGIQQVFTHFDLKGEVHRKQWRVEHLSAQLNELQLFLQAQGQLTAPYPLTGELQFRSQDNHTRSLAGHFNFGGDFNLYYWQGRFNQPLHGELHGSIKKGEILYTHAAWDSAQWLLSNNTYLKSNGGQITVTGQIPHLHINSKVQLTSPFEADLTLTSEMTEKQTTIKSLLHLPAPPLKTTIETNATIVSAEKAKVTLTFGQGSYQLPQDTPLQALPFQGGQLILLLKPNLLTAKGDIRLDEQKWLRINTKFPQFQWQALGDLSQNIDGTVVAYVNSLDFLKGVHEAINTISGQLKLELHVVGHLNKPRIKGHIALSRGEITIPKIGLHLNPIEINLSSHNQQWQAKGTMGSRGKTLFISGEGLYVPTLSGQMDVTGSDVPLIKTAEYDITASPNIKIGFDPTHLTINGQVLIPKAELKPISFSNTVGLPDDAVFVDETGAPTASPYDIATDVTLTMGKEVLLNLKGLRGYLDGNLQLKQIPHGTLNAVGELLIRNGQYSAYGQNLTIDKGELIFAGGVIDNPGIQIRASRTFTGESFSGSNQLLDFNNTNLDSNHVGNKTTVGVEVTGRLNAHQIKLFSIPSNLSQPDILSLLVLGKPANQANKAGGQLLLAAISSMNLDSGTKGMQLIDQLKKTTGIDVTLENNTLYNQKTNQATDNTSVVVTKTISNRLFLSYNIGLLQKDNNILTLRYLLNKFFSVQVNTSDSGSGMDLLYTHIKK